MRILIAIFCTFFCAFAQAKRIGFIANGETVIKPNQSILVLGNSGFKNVGRPDTECFTSFEPLNIERKIQNNAKFVLDSKSAKTYTLSRLDRLELRYSVSQQIDPTFVLPKNITTLDQLTAFMLSQGIQTRSEWFQGPPVPILELTLESENSTTVYPVYCQNNKDSAMPTLDDVIYDIQEDGTNFLRIDENF